MTFLLPLTLFILASIGIVTGLVFIFKDNENGPPLLFLSIIPTMGFVMSMICYTNEKCDLEYIHRARLHAEYVESGMIRDLDEYSDFCSQVVNANEMIIKAREKKDNIWIGYIYYESVANQELITLDINRNE